MSLESTPETVPPTTLPSPLCAAETPQLRSPLGTYSRTRRILTAQAAVALVFDLAILVAMAALAWELFMPWSRALDAADGLMALGLLVCGGLWTSFVEQDLWRWRRLRRTKHPTERRTSG